MSDYYAVCVEVLLKASGMQDARMETEKFFDTFSLELQDHGFEHWELRTIRGVTVAGARQIDLAPSPPFRGKFVDQTKEPQTTKEIEDAVDRMFRKRYPDA